MYVSCMHTKFHYLYSLLKTYDNGCSCHELLIKCETPSWVTALEYFHFFINCKLKSIKLYIYSELSLFTVYTYALNIIKIIIA